ncbi:TadE/TadG family type IV pilus assembly protein [Catellatospora sichuanensis]|uniref:TadE/TadG family type IV pilus assembly protein n=1 Tax=Catellatospora sichuanensis TaxID=1969805 RepID=UPI001181E6E5|nr:TadE/TadG family type IV pilus assembly protein [Catellatospora sichuanensis]
MAKRDRGAAAVEMALILPILLLLVFGIIDFGRMLNTQIKLTEAAREGARAATILNTHSGATSRVATVLGSTPVSVTVSGGHQPCLNALPGTDATVRVEHDFEFVTPFAAIAGLIGGTGPGDFTLSATGVMPCRS